MKLLIIHIRLDDKSRESSIERMNDVDKLLIKREYDNSLAREFDRLDVVINIPIDYKL